MHLSRARLRTIPLLLYGETTVCVKVLSVCNAAQVISSEITISGYVFLEAIVLNRKTG